MVEYTQQIYHLDHFKVLNRVAFSTFTGFPGSSDCKESACNARDLKFDSWVGKIPWSRKHLRLLDIYYLVPKHLSAKKETSYPLTSHSPFLTTPKIFVTTNLLSLSLNLPV